MISWANLKAFPKSNWIALIAILLAGTVATYTPVSYFQTKEAEFAIKTAGFRADWRARDFEHNVDRFVGVAAGVAAFVSSRPPETLLDYEAAIKTRSRYGRPTGLRSIIWCPLVLDADRDAFEAKARGATGKEDFRIFDIVPGVSRETAPRRNAYLPVYFGVWFSGTPVLGLDAGFGGGVSWNEYMQLRDRGGIWASRAFVVRTESRTSSPIITIAVPMYRRSEANLETVEARRATFEGVVLVTVDLLATLNEPIASTPDIVSSIELANAPFAKDQPTPIFGILDRTLGRFVPVQDIEVPPSSSSLVFDRDFRIGTRSYHMRLSYGLADVVGPERFNDEIALYAGATTTMLAAMTFFVFARRRLRMQADLRRANRDFELLIRVAPIPIIGLDTKGIVTRLNHAAELVFGYKRDEAVGREPPMTPADQQEEARSLVARMANGEQLQGIPLIRQTKDGRRINVVVFGGPRADSEGKIDEILLVYLDVTRQMELSQQLAEREASQKAILEALSDAVLVIDEFGKIEICNKGTEELFGRSREEIVGQNIAALVPSLGGINAGSNGGLPEGVFDRMVGKTAMSVARHKDRGSIPVEMSTTTVADGRDDKRNFAIAIRGIAERLTLQRSLVQSQKMEAVGQLTGGLSHDFNNLLGVIIGNLDMLRPKLTGPNLELLEEALGAASRGAELNRSLLAFSRQQPLEPQTVDPCQAINKLKGLLQLTLGERITVKTFCAAQNWMTKIDPTQFEAAVLNIAINSRDAMPQGGTLTIEVSNVTLGEDYASLNEGVAPGDYVAIAITDTGTGMSPEVQARAFDPFFTTKEVGKGTGLGLSMVFGFVKQSMGHVRIYSEVGRGTCIRIYLPRADHGMASYTPEHRTGVKMSQSETILVVEDNAGLRRVVLRQFAELGYRTIEAENAAAALEILRGDTPIDLLFSDIVMPGGMDGRALAAEAQRLRPGIKVLLTSGFSEESTKSQPEGLKARLLSKPYRLTQLAEAVGAVLDGSG